MNINVYYTSHVVNQTITQYLAKSQKYELKNINDYDLSNNSIFASYGILRGVGEIIKQNKNFIYMDHGFLKGSKRTFNVDKSTVVNLDGHIRVLRNDLYFNQTYSNYNSERFKNLNIVTKDLIKNGEYIILSEPTDNTSSFLGLENWCDKTISSIKKYTDRKIIVHNKFSKKSLIDLLKNAYAFVSCQSTAGFTSIINGVPAYFTHDSLKKFGDIKDIEKQKLNYDLLYLAANSQWKLSEFFSDEFKIYLDNIVNKC